MGKMAKLLTHEEVVSGGDKYPMIIERTIKQRVPEGKKINTLEYEQVLCDGISTPHIFDQDKEFLEKFVNVTYISFISCGLRSLSNFPKIKKVIKVDLQDNNIINGLEILIDRCPNMEILKLGNNKISQFDTLKKLNQHKCLKSLQIYGNPICEELKYTDKIFELLPELQILDGQDYEGNEKMTDEEELQNDDDSCDDYGDEQDMIADGVLQEQDDMISSGGSGIGEDEDKQEDDDDDDGYEGQKSSEESDPWEEEDSDDSSNKVKANNEQKVQINTKDSNKQTSIQTGQKKKSSQSSNKDSQQSSSSSSSNSSSGSESNSSSSDNDKLTLSQQQKQLQQYKITKKKMKLLEYSSGSDMEEGEGSSIINLGKRKAQAIRGSIYQGSSIQKRICLN